MVFNLNTGWIRKLRERKGREMEGSNFVHLDTNWAREENKGKRIGRRNCFTFQTK